MASRGFLICSYIDLLTQRLIKAAVPITNRILCVETRLSDPWEATALFCDVTKKRYHQSILLLRRKRKQLIIFESV